MKFGPKIELIAAQVVNGDKAVFVKFYAPV